MHAAVALLRGDRPGILVLDDVHCADSATLDWLTYCVHRMGAHPLCVVLVWHSAGVPAGHRLRQLTVAAATRQGDPSVLAAALNSLPLVQQALDHVVRKGHRHREAALRNTLADLHHACGDVPQAMDQPKLAVVISAEIDSGAGGENAEIWMLREW